MMSSEQIPQTPSPEQPKKKKTGFSGIMNIKKDALAPGEKERRESVAQRVKRVHELDMTLFRDIGVPGNPSESIERLEAAETLSVGKELKQEAVGEAENGLNAITKRTYEGDPNRIGYVKPQTGEASFRYDAKSGKAYKLKRVVKDGQPPKLVEEEIPEKRVGEIEMLKTRAEIMPVLIEDIAEYYGIKPGEVPLKSDEFSPRASVDAGDFTMREVVVSRIDQLTNFNVVPMTVIRAEKGNTDLLSVQEQAKCSFDSEATPRDLFEEDIYESIKQLGPKHPGAQSFMRIACMHYLTKKLDGHPGNILYFESTDEETKETKGEFKDIDNGLSLGLTRGEKKTMGDQEIVTPKPVDAIWSMPMEVIQEWNQDPKNKDNPWVLDEDALKGIKDLAGRLIKGINKDYSHLDLNTDPEATLPDLVRAERKKTHQEFSGKEARYLSGLFKELYGNQKIADKETFDFFSRLADIITHKKPPELPVGSATGHALAPVRELYGLEARKAAPAATPPPPSEEDEKSTRIENIR